MSNECSVCFEEYTSKNRLLLECVMCKKSACMVCYKKHVLSTTQVPHCMHCRRIFTTDVLNSMFSKHFRKTELRKHQIGLLMEQEKSLFAETMLLIEREDIQNEYLAAHEHHKNLLFRLSPRDTSPVDMILILEINDVRKKIKEITQTMNRLGIEKVKEDEKKERKLFIRKCPNCENGYLSTAWKCILCKTCVCSDCLEIKRENHNCNEENIESAKTIDKETKSCPCCGVRVQKSLGCNQMWCTNCNNAFDWRTGEKVNGPVHNPHYHDFIRRNLDSVNIQHEQYQNLCENNEHPGYWPYRSGLYLINLLRPKLTTLLSNEWTTKILNINRFMIERSATITEYIPYSPTSYLDLRKKRLRNTIDDSEWARQLSCRETTREKKNRFKLLDEMIISISRDIIGHLLQNTLITNADLIELFDIPIEKAREYYNEQMKKICEENDQHISAVNIYWILVPLK